MTSRSRESRRAAARAADGGSGRSRWLLIGAALAVVLAAGIGAILLSGSGDGGSSARPSTSPPGPTASPWLSPPSA